ncbi:peptidoglycan DD-metalloendopeptidase family protein [Herbaspirillum sp. WKF16]|jgi:lipoprotein NlpD|uniref:peptidoglycan DD-metalloendopeptidase family protein n=1 Tax=Herbaspirillum sp. WKF16 TaxID=3028312 RepID=UPI0023A9496F|nr:peptidoglycan DD-metalloendopeptidase family protein [Herbaspirillum sp. WKF16]WDZ94568.1 peptidoglycan DD-metalloendopeptidase family protein [Herbaspirillum sp. WKF16]
MKKIRLAVLGSVVGILAACSSTPNQQAPVVERTSSGGKAADVAAAAPAAAPAPSGRGYYTVKKGDTLYRIALEVGQSYRDIVAWNNLTNPNDIKVDQVLRVAPPGAVTAPQTAAVAAAPASGIEVKSLGAPGAAAPAAAAAGSNKTGPRGDKRAYSDSALAELEKPDVASAPAAAQAPAKADVAHPAEKPAASAAAAAPGDDEGVSWMWPAEGKVVGTFDGGKKGLDISGKSGQPVMAAGAGKVMYAGSGIRGYGNLVIIKHTNNLLSAYAHNKTILVKEGQSVTKGQKIAEMGNSDSDSVKLHFEIRQQGKPVDPSKYLPPR